MRAVRPAEKARAGYPRLARGWRVLLAAPIAFLPSLALGDATIPHDGNNNDHGPGDQKKPDAPPPEEYPTLRGEIATPQPPTPPPTKKKGKPQPKVGMVLHRHAPGEPCRRIA